MELPLRDSINRKPRLGLRFWTREALEIEVNTSLPGPCVVRLLEGRKQQGQKPKHIIIDDGMEFSPQVVDRWGMGEMARTRQ